MKKKIEKWTVGIIQFAFIILFTFFLFSCSCLKKVENNSNGTVLTESNLTLLDGWYERKSKDYLRGDLCWIFFSSSYSHLFDHNCYEFKGEFDFFELKVINKNKILVSHIHMMNDTLSFLSSKIMKGKIKDGYFEYRRTHLFLPVILTNVYRDSKIRIKLSNDENLLMDFKQITFGTGFFIIPFYERETENDMIFRRIEKTVE